MLLEAYTHLSNRLFALNVLNRWMLLNPLGQFEMNIYNNFTSVVSINLLDVTVFLSDRFDKLVTLLLSAFRSTDDKIKGVGGFRGVVSE